MDRKSKSDYKTVMKPLKYSATEQAMEAEISATFDGSPIVLAYQFELKDKQIESLKIG